MAEILVEGRKLIGSAQRIRGSASKGRFFLQHGSIPLDDPVPLMLSVFRHAKEEDLRQKMHSLESLGIYPKKNRESLQLLLKDCISECFGLQWVKQPGFSSEADKIKKTMNNFPDLSRDLQAYENHKNTRSRPMILEKMTEGA